MTPNTAVPKPQAPDWQAPEPVGEANILIVGDTGFGQSYVDHHGVQTDDLHDAPFTRLRGLLDSSDLVVANLETVLTDRRDSPLEGKRPYLHYDDPTLSTTHLRKHGIAAVTFANNHVMDMGEAGFLDTLNTLEDNDILYAGAGRDRARADEPLRISIPFSDGTHRGVTVFAGLRASEEFDELTGSFATADSPGCNPLETDAVTARIEEVRKQSPDELIIVVPHWRRDYKWASNAQRSFASSVTAAGADLVIGHGSHMAQEIDILNGRPLLHGIGNFVFNSNGRYAQMDAPPYSIAVRLRLTAGSTRLRLYPLHTDNGTTGFRTGPVDAAQFEEFYLDALARTAASSAFLRAVEPGADTHGHYLDIDLNRNHRARVNRHRRGQGTTLTYWEESPKKIRFDRRTTPNTLVLERELKRQGATIRRLESGALAGRSKEGIPYLLLTSSTHHSGVPGARAAKRKNMTREILQDQGLSIAPGGFFGSQDDFDAAARLLGELGPVVVKPMDGNVGRGVTVGVEDANELKAAWDLAFSETHSGVLVEQQFRGDEIRISVVDGVACAATRRIPPQITGDGSSTIRELINARNDERHRELVLHSKPLDLDGNRLRTLLRAGLTPLTVLPEGTTHIIDHMGSVGSGAHPENCIETMDPSYLRVAERAALAFHDIDIAGIDVLCEDLSRPATDDNHIIIEINTRPEIAVHSARPSERAPQSFPTRIVSSVLAPDVPSTFLPRVRKPVPPENLSSAALLAAEFTARNMDVTWYGDRYFRASGGVATASVWGASTDRTGTAARFSARNDVLMQSLLRRARLPIRRAGAEASGDGGTRLRFLVAHSRVLAVIDPSDPRRRNALRHVHRSHRALVAAAARAITGLDLAEVTLTAADPGHPARKGTVVVDDVRPDPDLVAFTEAADPRTDIVKTIVDLHLGAAEPAPEPSFTWAAEQKGTPGRVGTTVVDAAKGAKRIARGLRRRIGGD